MMDAEATCERINFNRWKQTLVISNGKTDSVDETSRQSGPETSRFWCVNGFSRQLLKFAVKKYIPVNNV